MIELLQGGQAVGLEKLDKAIEEALESGSVDRRDPDSVDRRDPVPVVNIVPAG